MTSRTLYASPADGGGGGGGTAIKVVQASITTGDVTFPSTSGAWQALSGFEISIAAAVGDYLDLSVHALRSQAPTSYIDLAVIVGSSIVRYITTGTSTAPSEGSPGLYPANDFVIYPGPRGFTVASGDRDGANVRVIVACKAAGSGTLFASTTYPFYWRIINFGAPA